MQQKIEVANENSQKAELSFFNQSENNQPKVYPESVYKLINVLQQKSTKIKQDLWHSSIQEFYNGILTDSVLRMSFQSGMTHCQKKKTLYELMNSLQAAITDPLPYMDNRMIGCPISVLLMDFMSTPEGYQFFRNSKVNKLLKPVLDAFGQFLKSEASTATLNQMSPNGWFCKEARLKYDIEEFQIQKQEPNYGFKSWNDFFIRKFKQGRRPVEFPDDSSIINNACESTPEKLQSNVKKYDQFWIKSQPYSLFDIFAAQSMKKTHLAQKYIGGVVYQAFLDPLCYHRWHSPIDGTVIDIYNIQGTYFSETQAVGVDLYAPEESQPYLTEMATRLIIAIEAADKRLGIVSLVFIGMVEISSCLSQVKIGDKVRKGEELGYFQYGGSSYCLIFQPGVIQKFYIEPHNERRKINSMLAKAVF